MMTVPDRNMGICQEVCLDWTGPGGHPPSVRRHRTAAAGHQPRHAGGVGGTGQRQRAPVRGVLRGRVAGTDVRFEQPVELGPKETKLVRVDPKPVMQNPRLWWPVNYGEQHLYDLALQIRDGRRGCRPSRRSRFGVRQITSEMHELDGWHGRRVLVNGQKIFCRGGYIQPELLFDWDARRIENEIRYFADANMNLIYFEDIPNPPDAFLDACDRHGVLFGNCFYACSWATRPGQPGGPRLAGAVHRGRAQALPQSSQPGHVHGA